MAFAVLIALLAGIGQFGLRRMQTIDKTFSDITGRELTDLQLARRAVTLSDNNSRITMEIVLVENRALVNSLLAVRSENNNEVTRLVEKIEGRCESEIEKRLLSEVKKARQPYVDSSVRAIHLLVNEGEHDKAEEVIVEETMPAMHKYRAAWDEFVEFQDNKVEVAAEHARVDYARAHRFAVLLGVLAFAIAFGIALFATRQAQKSYQREVTARKDIEIDLWRSDERMRMAVEAARIGFWDWDVIRDQHVWSDICKELLGLQPESAASFQAWMNSVHPDDRKMMVDGVNVAMEKKGHYDVEFRVVWPDGSVHWQASKGRAFHDETGNTTRMAGIAMDITARKVAEERVQYLAYYDALTGLPSRTLLQDRLTRALASARREKDKVALLFLDLDRFKDINDSLGHSVGDLLLKEVAERLKTWGREQDTVARLGGDEFLITLTHVKDLPDVAVATERLMDAMTAGFVIQGHTLNVSCSIGISIFPEHGTDGETLIKNADAAMYSVKGNGRGNFQLFTNDMNAQVVERLTLESGLRSALAKKQLFLVYQPQVNIATGEITGLEALLRWQHPELGLVPPDKFIRIAENSGLIVPIGEWVLRTACNQARKWQDEGIRAVSVAVNVSAVQFRQVGFCELIRRVLNETGLPPQYLELELTESLLLANAEVTLSVLKELKSMGVTLAIDDFGTGYSSFGYLRQFQVSKLKIDRLFIRDVDVNPNDAAITTAIIGMAKSLNLKVIAEGVENEAQMSFLRAHQCDEIQGYYFSKPLAVADVAHKLRGDTPESLVRVQTAGNHDKQTGLVFSYIDRTCK